MSTLLWRVGLWDHHKNTAPGWFNGLRTDLEKSGGNKNGLLAAGSIPPTPTRAYGTEQGPPSPTTHDRLPSSLL